MPRIINQLNQQLQADLQLINHKSLNNTFVGYSQLFQQSIFVKQFVKKQAYLTEKNVTNQLNDRVLTGFPLNDSFILVLEDWSPKDIKQQINSKLAFEMGVVLGDFHLKVQPFPGIKVVKNQFDNYLAEINTFCESSYKKRLKELVNKFLPYKNEIQSKLSAHSNYVLHGDVESEITNIYLAS